MEASRFGFGDDMPPAFKFDPTDADLIACYLLPRALGLDNPYAHAIIDDDPMSLPPPELLQKHRHGGSDRAFFFGPSRNAGCVKRTVMGDGKWQGQISVDGTVTLLCHDGYEVDIGYRRYDLAYKRREETGSSGWVMREYQITSPPLLSTVLTSIGFAAAKKKQRPQPAEAEAPADEVPRCDEEDNGRLKRERLDD